jgi:hypothetical protein
MPTQAIPRQQIATQGQVQGSAFFCRTDAAQRVADCRHRRAAPELLNDVKPIDGGLEASFRSQRFFRNASGVA